MFALNAALYLTMLFCMFMLPTPVFAAGYWTLERGPSNFARGGANTADPQDPMAMYTNPAALAGLSGLQLNVDSSWVGNSQRFQRAEDNANSGAYIPVENSAKNPITPGVFLNYNFERLGLKSLSIGLGIYGPPKADRTWPRDGPQRYHEVTSNNLQAHYTLALAYEFPWKRLRLGFSAQAIKQTIATSLVLNAVPEGLENPDVPEDTDFDVLVAVKAQSKFIPGGIMALSLKPFDNTPFIVSLTYQLPYNVVAEGKAELQLGSLLEAIGAKVEGDAVAARLSMPGVLRWGMLYGDPTGAFDIELTLVWEQWQRNKEIVFQPKGIAVSTAFMRNEIPDVVLQQDWQDTVSIRLGGAYALIKDRVRLRAGAFYESSAVKPGLTTVSTLDLPKLGATIGGRIDIPVLGGLWIDLAAGYSYWLPRTVTGGKSQLLNGLTGKGSHIINNGVYSNQQLLLLAGLGIRLDI